ncbi:MAG: hypothetical protein M3360_07995 [Actinomycetota bacterium]|nr:hypothetical protein [Actinomycetota bacterium]
MRAHSGTILILILALIYSFGAPPAIAISGPGVILAQDPAGEDNEAEGQEGGGGNDSAAETGASAEETEGSTETAGPPWTLFMAYISIVLLLLLALAIARWYYLFVVARRRSEV